MHNTGNTSILANKKERQKGTASKLPRLHRSVGRGKCETLFVTALSLRALAHHAAKQRQITWFCRSGEFVRVFVFFSISDQASVRICSMCLRHRRPFTLFCIELSLSIFFIFIKSSMRFILMIYMRLIETCFPEETHTCSTGPRDHHNH